MFNALKPILNDWLERLFDYETSGSNVEIWVLFLNDSKPIGIGFIIVYNL